MRCETMSVVRALAITARKPRQDLLLGLRVDRRQRVVENQDARIDDQSARAMAVRCFCPPDSVMPRSPMRVS